MESDNKRSGIGSDADLKKQKRQEQYAKAEKAIQDAEKQGALHFEIPAQADRDSKTEAFSDVPKTGTAELSYSDQQFDYYYPKFLNFKKEHLGGKVHKPIRDELGLYLKGGRKHGADSRQASPNRYKIAWDAAVEWKVEFNGTQKVELFRKFKQLNNPNDSLYKD